MAFEEEEDAFFNFDRASRNLKKTGDLFGNAKGAQELERHSRTLKNNEESKLGKISFNFSTKKILSSISGKTFENNDR